MDQFRRFVVVIMLRFRFVFAFSIGKITFAMLLNWHKYRTHSCQSNERAMHDAIRSIVAATTEVVLVVSTGFTGFHASVRQARSVFKVQLPVCSSMDLTVSLDFLFLFFLQSHPIIRVLDKGEMAFWIYFAFQPRSGASNRVSVLVLRFLMK